MNIGTLAQKNLIGDSKLKLISYQLDHFGADALGRPVGSKEIVLELDEGYGFRSATPPKASWYLNEVKFRQLYDAIRHVKDFKQVQNFLDGEINSPADAKKVDSLLGRMQN